MQDMRGFICLEESQSFIFNCKGSKITSPVTAGVASSLSEKIVQTIGSSRPNAPLTAIQINFIQNMIQETMDDFRYWYSCRVLLFVFNDMFS